MVVSSNGSSAAAASPRMGHEVDHQGHALERVGLAQAVLQVVGPVAVDQFAVVALDRGPRRSPAGGLSWGGGGGAAARGARGSAVGRGLARLRPRVAEQVITAGRRRSF